MIIKKSKEHLRENNMGYFEHLKFASGHGIECIKAGILLITHSLIPAWFSKAGIKLTNKLNKSFTNGNDWLNLKKRMEIFHNVYYSKK